MKINMLLNFDWNAKIGSEMERILAIFCATAAKTFFFLATATCATFLLYNVHVVRASAWSGGVVVPKVPNSHS